MHDIRSIRDNPAAFDAALKRRGLEPLSASLLAIDERRRGAIQEAEQALARRNAASKEIGEAKKNKDAARADTLMNEVAALKAKLPELEAAAKQSEDELKTALAQIPNLPLDEVPDGADEHGNVQHHIYGAARSYSFKPKEHVELGEGLGFMDFETAAKLSGARFVVLKKGIARLERAIGQFFLDVHTGEHGYTEVNPPLLVRDDAMFGTAQLPKFRDDQFAAHRTLSDAEINLADDQALFDAITKSENAQPNDDEILKIKRAYLERLDQERASLWLIPTAEVPLTNLVRESILDEKQLPMRLTALTPCFRAEAGAADATRAA
ncbi:Serine--tRNA ligase [Afipia felis]|uniref:Serine--tRNA ligase n=1 Tax=Afipia felis TaxID=1035 RepID=A0A090MKL1_AFIFE|nr:Serine--tRNA ligase [Afipia felis]